MIGEGVTRVPVPKERRRGSGRRPYPKQCYARAGMYQLEHPDVTLVHGIVDKGLGPFVHAWCELPEGLVFDGADNAFYDLTEYRRRLRVASERRYSARDAAERAYRTGIWSAWDIPDSVLADYLRPTRG